MAYASGTPRSWTTGELVTASFMNGIRDALNEATPAILTTAGDMLYASSGTVRARLPKGTAGQVLKMNSGATAPEWGSAAPLGVRVHRSSTDQSIPNATSTLVDMNAEDLDQGGWHDNATNPSRITAPAAGLIWVYAQIVWDYVNTVGNREVQLCKNGTAVVSGYTVPLSGDLVSVTASLVDVCAAGDYYEVKARQTSGGALDVLTSNATMLQALLF